MKNILIGVVVLLALIAVGLVIVAISANQGSTLNSSNTPTSTAIPTQLPVSSAVTPEDQTLSQSQSITIDNFAFNPATLIVPVGATVTWTNNDTAAHTVVSDLFSSNNLVTGDTFSYTFTTAGTYSYHCSIHPSMVGQIIVQ